MSNTNTHLELSGVRVIGPFRDLKLALPLQVLCKGNNELLRPTSLTVVAVAGWPSSAGRAVGEHGREDCTWLAAEAKAKVGEYANKANANANKVNDSVHLSCVGSGL